jgi:EAL domain-containing protein (putative c-di-GMP-specific phosphodiesterase class I)
VTTHRAAHRQPTATAIGRRQLWARRQPTTLADQLTRPDVIEAAIKADQLRLFYHPIVQLAGTSVVGHEVLIRWQHPDHGLLSPAQFLPYIDSSPGLSHDLGTWVLQQACSAAMQHGDQLHLSVNISEHHLGEVGFADHLTQILRVTGFSPTSLILEIKDAALRHANAQVVGTCTVLTDLGVTFALDNFAINQTNLDQLNTLPLGILKIDRSVTAGIGSKVEAEQFIVRTVELAQLSGRRTIAEGVETHDQARFLREHDATFAQGYLYGRPKPHS